MQAFGPPEYELASEEVAPRVEAGEIQLLDVREPQEWEAGHAVGAVHIPMQSVPTRLGELDQSKPVACICLSGMRSAAVADHLRANGFEAYNVTDGFAGWFEAELPSEPEGARVLTH